MLSRAKNVINVKQRLLHLWLACDLS